MFALTRLFIGILLCTSVLAGGMSRAAAQPADSVLRAEISQELRAARDEAEGMLAPSPITRPSTSAMDAYSTLFPLCNAPAAEPYYIAFASAHGLEEPIDLQVLSEEIFAARSQHGFWQEARWPAETAVGYSIVSRAALDWAFGEWLGQHYLFRAEGPEASRSAAAALVFRAWCRVRTRNEAILSDFITAHGFPSEARFDRQVESMALYILKHSNDASPLVTTYERSARRAHARHELSDANYAFFLDTLAVFRGQPQPVGSYYGCDGGQAVYDPPLENLRRAERLRRRYGLEPIAEDLARASRETCGADSTVSPEVN